MQRLDNTVWGNVECRTLAEREGERRDRRGLQVGGREREYYWSLLRRGGDSAWRVRGILLALVSRFSAIARTWREGEVAVPSERLSIAERARDHRLSAVRSRVGWDLYPPAGVVFSPPSLSNWSVVCNADLSKGGWNLRRFLSVPIKLCLVLRSKQCPCHLCYTLKYPNLYS